MTRPILHRQSGSWTDAASYAPDLYASLAAVTLPPKGGAIAFGTVAGRASPEPQSTVRLGQKATIAIARKWVRVGGNWFAPEGTQMEDTFI